MESSKPRRTIAIAVVQQDDCFLVGMRQNDTDLAGYHEFPGGKVRDGESLQDAARRETLEETGVDVRINSLLLEQTHEYDHVIVDLHFFAAQPKQPGLPEPHGPFRWVGSKQLRDCRFPAGNQTLLDQMLR